MVNEPYIESGATASDDKDGRVFVHNNSKTAVDTTKAGTYTVTYSAKDAAGNNATATRTVKVNAKPDKVAPVITLIGDSEVTLTVDGTYTDQGATATDDVDGVVAVTNDSETAIDEATVGIYTVTYTATDAAGNMATAARTVTVNAKADITPPVILLNGDAAVSIPVNGTYTELGATATDDVDGAVLVTDDSEAVVDTTKVGIYTITYMAMDEAGNKVTITRTVTIADITAPVITLNGDAAAILTVHIAYEDPGATALDDVDGIIIVTDDSETAVDVSKVGTYTITYTAMDAAGNKATATRAVTLSSVLFDNRIQISNVSNKLVGGATEQTIISVGSYNFSNTSYFCDVDITGDSNLKIMSSYGTYDASRWKMTTLSNQAAAAQAYFDKTPGYENYKVVGILIGDTFNMSTGEPTGALVMNGVTYHNANEGRPYFAILEDGTAVVRESNVPLDDCVSAVGGFEIILKDGVVGAGLKTTTDQFKKQMYSRAAVGIKADGSVVTMVTHGFTIPVSYGLNYYEVASYMKSMGCVDVLMLDGGGSSQWSSMYEGTDELRVRNHPSDGSERQVGSSLLVVSTAAGDGEFDHATITPTATVYTPNASVDFTATGVDGAGDPADIPVTAFWELADSSFGSINQDGLFSSTGKSGEVTVQLRYDGSIVGTSTITIAVPDVITFESSEISIGRSQVSDLGISVLYQGRKVNFRAGDLVWSMSNPNMGTVSMETNTFTASPNLTTEGSITVKSVYDETVYGTIKVLVGQDPTMAMNFEDYTAPDGTVTDAYTYWGTDASGKVVGRAISVNNVLTYLTPATGMITTVSYGRNGNESAEIVSRADGYPVHLGSNALKINYDMSAATGTEGASVGLNQNYEIPGNPTAIGLWVYVPDNTPNLWLRVRLGVVVNGNAPTFTQFNFTEDCKTAFTTKGTFGGLNSVEPGSWKFLSADLSSYAGAAFIMPAGENIRVMWTTNPTPITSTVSTRTDITNSNGIYLANGTTIPKSECVGSLYVDDMMFIYGSINEDAKEPTITSFTANSNMMTEGMTFGNRTISFKAMFGDEYDSANNVEASGIDFDNVYMYVDGRLMENAVVDNGGLIQLDGVTLANGEHSVKLMVCDVNGNERITAYRFFVNDEANTATTVRLVARQSEAVLGKTVDLDVVSSELSHVDGMTMTLQIEIKYKDLYAITPGAGYTIDAGSIAFDKVHNTVTFTANRDLEAVSSGNGTLATISFKIPATIAEGSYFNCSMAGGSIIYTSSYTDTNQSTFSSVNYQIPVASPYIISSDVIVSGMSNSYFYVQDASGNAAPGLSLYFNDGSLIGTTDEAGKVAVPVSIYGGVNDFTVYAKDANGSVSFSFSGQSFAAGGAADGQPVYIRHYAATDGDTIRKITWMSNPVYSSPVSMIQVSNSIENIGNGMNLTGISKLFTFAGSATTSENYAARINGVTVTGLIPGTEYFYRVGDGVTWSAVEKFTIPAGSETNLFILGDVQAENLTNIQTILTTLNQDAVEYDLGIQTGDAVELASLYSDWSKSLNLMDNLQSDQVMLQTLGNHELTGKSGEEISTAFYNLDNPLYYSVNYGQVYVATISHMSSMADYEKALKWLVEDAAKSDAPYKILVMHQPAYYTNVSDPSNEELHNLLPAYAELAGIDMVFSGHDHSYARTEAINGVTYYICGSTGEKAYPVTDNEAFNFAVVTGDFTATYLTVKATNESITVTTFDLIAGVPTIIDTFTKLK